MLEKDTELIKMAKVTEFDYTSAQQSSDPEVRQDFLNAVDLEDAREFVKKVRYIIPPKKVKKPDEPESDWIYREIMSLGASMTCEPDSFHFLLSKGIFVPRSRKSFMNIYPHAFLMDYSSFLSGVIYHEGQHARQNFRKWGHTFINNNRILRNKKNKQKIKYFKLIHEIPACANQIAKCVYRGISESYAESISEYIQRALAELTCLKNSFPKPRNPVKDLQEILCDSEGDDFIREMLGNQNRLRGELLI